MDLSLLSNETWNDIMLGAGVSFALVLFMLFVALITGYWMGRNSAEKSVISKEGKIWDPGSTEEPEEGDIFKDAMADESDKRISTT